MITLQEGQKAPEFSGCDHTGNRISLSDYKGKKLVLFFYPADGTPTCTAEACNLRDHYQELRAVGYELLGVSPDSAKKHQNFIRKQGLPFPLLADENLEVIKAFGVWGKKKMYGREYDGLHRTTFIINENGIIEKIIHKVEALRHSDQILGKV